MYPNRIDRLRLLGALLRHWRERRYHDELAERRRHRRERRYQDALSEQLSQADVSYAETLWRKWRHPLSSGEVLAAPDTTLIRWDLVRKPRVPSTQVLHQTIDAASDIGDERLLARWLVSGDPRSQSETMRLRRIGIQSLDALVRREQVDCTNAPEQWLADPTAQPSELFFRNPENLRRAQRRTTWMNGQPGVRLLSSALPTPFASESISAEVLKPQFANAARYGERSIHSLAAITEFLAAQKGTERLRRAVIDIWLEIISSETSTYEVALTDFTDEFEVKVGVGTLLRLGAHRRDERPSNVGLVSMFLNSRPWIFSFLLDFEVQWQRALETAAKEGYASPTDRTVDKVFSFAQARGITFTSTAFNERISRIRRRRTTKRGKRPKMH